MSKTSKFGKPLYFDDDFDNYEFDYQKWNLGDDDFSFKKSEKHKKRRNDRKRDKWNIDHSNDY